MTVKVLKCPNPDCSHKWATRNTAKQDGQKCPRCKTRVK